VKEARYVVKLLLFVGFVIVVADLVCFLHSSSMYVTT